MKSSAVNQPYMHAILLSRYPFVIVAQQEASHDEGVVKNQCFRQGPSGAPRSATQHQLTALNEFNTANMRHNYSNLDYSRRLLFLPKNERLSTEFGWLKQKNVIHPFMNP